MSCRSITCCSAPRNPSSRARESNSSVNGRGTHPRRPRRPAGGGRTCPPAAGPAGRCRPRSPPRRRRPPRPAAICPAVSSASGSISGVITAAPAGIRFGGTCHLGGRSRSGQPRRGRRLRTAPAPPPPRPRCPQPLDQPHRQQRMPAQVEEVILRPDPVQPEHLARTPRTRSPRPHVAGPRPAAACSPGAGSAARSTFPLAVSGSASSTTTAAGTMYSGSRAAAYAARRRRQIRPVRRPGRRRTHVADQPPVSRACPRGPSPPPGPPPGRRPAPPRPHRARPGTRGSSPDHRPARRTPAPRPPVHRARSPVRYIRSPGPPERARHKPLRRSAPPGPDTRAPAPPPPHTAPRPPPPAPGTATRPAQTPGYWPPAARSALPAARSTTPSRAAADHTVVSVGP